MLKGMSNYWVQRVNESKTNPVSYGYYNVCGPDTSHPAVNNSGFTNMVAVETLNYSIRAAEILNVSYPAKWKMINYDNMEIAYDSKNEYHPEFEGYTLGEAVNQPGIIYFGYPYKYYQHVGEDDIYLNDINTYYNVSYKLHTMQWSFFMINYMILNKYDLAMKSFEYTLGSLVENASNPNPFKVWTEGSDGSGADHFVTDQGGFLQTFLYGFGGLDINDNYLGLNTQFMPYEQMNFIGIDYRNNVIDFEIFNISKAEIVLNITVTKCMDVDKYGLMISYANATKISPLTPNKTVSVSSTLLPGKIYNAHTYYT